MSERRLLGPPILPHRPEDILAQYNKVLMEYYGVLRELQDSLFVFLAEAPEKPREGMIRLADGTNWDPGSGKGLYQYLDGVWTKL